jgi:hypothetical protein
MPKKAYPLDLLARIREDRAEAKTRELGGAVRDHAIALARREGAEADRDAARDRASRVRDEERAALERGALCVRDLVQGSLWESRTKADDAERKRAVDEAVASELAARASEAEIRAEAARARGESKVVQRHGERWRAEVKKEEESREDEGLAEAYRSKSKR